MTRQERDHLRYIAHQSERQAKQRDYYRSHRDQCRESVKRSKRKRDEKLRELLIREKEL